MSEFIPLIKPACAVLALSSSVALTVLAIRLMGYQFNPLQLAISVAAVIVCVEVFVLCVPLSWLV